ncbi:Glutamate receptor 1.3 [Heracleum sosnowskyi]|uniref:Glutamate receptor 1.3 n=1 Tax=Heracleum sosnowskyi TaxID=360622 RepID=A0AAD8H2T1_9APIA|nr:Glutamate receptor 1.3 [Heracleum sosnowskyi]
MNAKELSAYGVWAYDAIWALARAVEGVNTQIDSKSTDESSSESKSANAGVSHIRKKLLNKLVKTRLKGLSGDFQIVNMTVPLLKAFEIENVIREGERRVGFWVKGVGITREIMHSASSHNNLRNYNAAVGDISIMAERSRYVDFTNPYTDIGVGTIAKRKNNKDMWIFAKSIGVDLCLVTVVFFILTGLLIWAIEKPTNKDFEGSPSEQLGTIFFSTIFFSSGEKLSSNLSRFVMLIWAFLVLILTSSYTATLASMLTVQQIGLASKAFVGYQTGSLVERNIANNINYKDYRLCPYSSAEEYADALTKGSKNGGVDDILDEMPYIKAFLSKYSADYAMVDSASSTNGFGFAFQKGSPLVPDMSTAIAELREDGRLEMLEKKWYNKPPSLVNQETQPKLQVLKKF